MEGWKGWTYPHIHARTALHAHIHTSMHARRCTHTSTHPRTHGAARTYPRTHARILSRTVLHAHMRACTHTRATHTRLHAPHACLRAEIRARVGARGCRSMPTAIHPWVHTGSLSLSLSGLCGPSVSLSLSRTRRLSLALSGPQVCPLNLSILSFLSIRTPDSEVLLD
jgi:hypothetical protein